MKEEIDLGIPWGDVNPNNRMVWNAEHTNLDVLVLIFKIGVSQNDVWKKLERMIDSETPEKILGLGVER